MSTTEEKLIPKARDERKIVLALQFWEGDRDRAMNLARLIADIEPEFNPKVDFCFVARFDCVRDPETVEYVSKKFKVWTLKGTRRSVGWPAGCNDLAIDLLHQSAGLCRPGGAWREHKALYLMEPDVLPMCRDWLKRLSDEWDVAQEHEKFVLGAWSPFHSAVGHINGNMLVAPDLVFRVPGIIGSPETLGWDAFYAGQFSPHWWKSILMQNHYDYRKNIPQEVLFSCVDGITPPAVIHGVKDLSAEQSVRKILFG